MRGPWWVAGARASALLWCLVLSTGPLLAAQQRHEFERPLAGAPARVVLYAHDAESARRAAEAAFERLDVVRRLCDRAEGGELAHLAAAAGVRPEPLSPGLAALLRQALDLARASGGAFDPTVGPLLDLHRDARLRGLSLDPEQRASALDLVGWRRVVVEAGAGTVLLSRAGMSLDLEAVAAGHAVDQARDLLAAAGCPVALVAWGAARALGEAPPGTAGWPVTVGRAVPGRPPRVLRLSHVSLASTGASGSPEPAASQAAVVDPRSGAAVTGDARCLTVIAGTGVDASGLLGACRVLGPRAGRALVGRFAGARLVVDDPRDRALFDGTSLEGWSPVGGRYDGHASWAVEDGQIVGRVGPRGTGGLLYAAAPARDLHLELEVRIDHPFDSGVFLRMAPEGRGLQITLDDRPGGEIGAIYADGFLQHNPNGGRLWRRAAWNHLEVELSGDDMLVDCWLNGEHLVHHQVPADSEGFAPDGLIGLQVHGGQGEDPDQTVAFRELVVRPLR